MPVIDSHHHLWDTSAHPQPWLESSGELAPLRRKFTVADLAPLAAAEGVTATVVVQTVTETWETPELLALAAGGGLVAGVVGEVCTLGVSYGQVCAAARALTAGLSPAEHDAIFSGTARRIYAVAEVGR